MTLLAIIAPARPAALPVSDFRRFSSWGYRRARAARREGGPSGRARSSFRAGSVDMSPVTVPNALQFHVPRAPPPNGSLQCRVTMARARLIATVLVTAVLLPAGTAGAVVHSKGRL